MALYSINQISRITGVKTHTLRMWEKRYGIIVPNRTYTNIRYYKESELALVQAIALLTSKGHKISKLGDLNREEVFLLAEKVRLSLPEYDVDTDKHVTEVMNFDEAGIRDRMEKSRAERGMMYMFENLVLPTMSRLRLLWLTGRINSAHEGFYYAIVKSIFIREIAAVNRKLPADALRFVLYPYISTRQHFGIPLLRYFLEEKDIMCFEMGMNTDIDDLDKAILTIKPAAIITFIIEQMSNQNFISMVISLSNASKNTSVFIITNDDYSQLTKFPANVKCFPDVQSVLEYSESIKKLQNPE